MKKAFSIALITTGALTLLFAQTNVMKPEASSIPGSPGLRGSILEESVGSVGTTKAYDKKYPPALSLPDAYALALTELRSDTNQDYCVSASCLDAIPPIPNVGANGQAGWTFEFSNTNGIQKRVFVYFDKTAFIDNGERFRGF